MISVLVLEEDKEFLGRLTNALRSGFSNFHFLTAGTVSEAQMLLEEYPISLLLTTSRLRDGHGLDFLCDVKTVKAETPSILIRTHMEEDLEAKAKLLGVHRVLIRPVPPDEVCRVVSEILKPADLPTEEASQFKASLSCLTTIDIIQLKCLARSTQVLKFELPGGKVGKLHFQRGEIIHAETTDLQGVDAFNVIVGWKGGRVDEAMEPITSTPTIRADWQTLLMDAVVLMDEASESTLQEAAA
jgi:DNA-binding response OmpR family regulator